MINLVTADEALKSYYLDVVAEQLNQNANPFLAAVKESTADVWGKEVRKLARYGVNGGIGAGTETGNLPAASSNKYKQMVATLKNLYGTIEISDKAIKASESNAGAFVNLLNAEMEGLVRSSSYNFGRMLFGDGTGIIAAVTDITSGVITLTSVKALAEGMVIDFLDKTSHAALAAGRTVLSVDRATKKITVSGTTLTSTDVPDDSVITLQGSYNNEITGLKAIFNTSASLYGLSRTDYPFMKPYSYALNGAISESAIQTAIDKIEENSGSKVNFILCSLGVRRALQALFASSARNVDVMELKGGYTAMSYNGIPIVADRFCDDGTMYLLNTDDFTLHQLCDWQWLEGEDGNVLKQVAGKPIYTATLVKYAELMCDKPCGQGVITGITEG